MNSLNDASRARARQIICAECAELREEFVQEEIAAQPHFSWLYDEDGTRYLRAEVHAEIQHKADAYYLKTLVEKGSRIAQKTTAN